MRAMLKRLFSLAAALAASACDGPATVSSAIRSPATWSTLTYATKDGPMLLDVNGPGLEVVVPDLPRKVVQLMSVPVDGRAVVFTLDPAQARQPEIRVLVVFDPVVPLNPSQICAGKGKSGPGEPNKITVTAVFCNSEQVLSSVDGWVKNVTGPNDKNFRLLMSQVTRELFGGGKS
jgi:hypothetical protein